MKNFLLLIFTLNFLCGLSGQDVDNQNTRDNFLEAESYFLYEEYTEALPLYLRLYKADTDNDNLAFKVGVCYLNIPYEKQRSITYLEKAVKNINPEYKVNAIKERQAPLDALFYLGNAYRVNNQLNDALKTYKEFKGKLNPELYDVNLVEEQISSIERAKRYQSKPMYFTYTNLGEPINSKFAETNAVTNPDETVLLYNVKLQFYDALFYTRKINGKWTSPINIIPDLGVDGDVYATSVSYDGTELMVYRSDNYDGNIYVSRFVNDRWTPIKRLNDNINTKYWESHASLSSDGKTLYFTSNRKGGYGGLDIYSATRSDKAMDEWTNVQNLGPEINTSYNEETPFVSDDNKTIYFSSYGHFNMGGYDIFYSNLLENNKWSTPLNMGYPINTTDDDVFFVPVKGGDFGYVCRYYDENIGKTDIYRVEIFSKQHPRKFMLKGLVNLPTELKNDNVLQLSALILNKNSKDTVQLLNLNALKTDFDTKLIAGNYQLIIQGKGIQKATEDFSIENTQSSNEVTVLSNVKAAVAEPIVLKAEETQEVLPLQLPNSFFKVFSAKKVLIDLNLPKGSEVNISAFIDSSLVFTDAFVLKSDNKNFVYYKPQPGKNIVKINAVTSDNKHYKGEVVVIYEQLPDTLSFAEIKELIDQKQFHTKFAKSILWVIATDSLKSILNATDIEKENLSAVPDLIEYLKIKCPAYGISTSEVDSVARVYYQSGLSLSKILLTSYATLSNGQLRFIADSLLKADTVSQVGKIIDDVYECSKSNPAALTELLTISSHLAFKGDVYYCLNALRKVASGNLKRTLDTLGLSRNNIVSASNLMTLLLNESVHKAYSKQDVCLAYFSMPHFTSIPEALLQGMIVASSGAQKDVLVALLKDNTPIKDNKELGSILLRKIPASDSACNSLLQSLISADLNSYYNQLLSDLLAQSPRKLKAAVNAYVSENKGINNVDELVTGLLKNHTHDTLLKKQLIKTLAYVSVKNLFEAERFTQKTNNGKIISLLNIGLISIFALFMFVIVIFAYRKKD